MSEYRRDANDAGGVGCIALAFAVSAFILATLPDQRHVRRLDSLERDVSEIKKALNIQEEQEKETK